MNYKSCAERQRCRNARQHTLRFLYFESWKIIMLMLLFHRLNVWHKLSSYCVISFCFALIALYGFLRWLYVIFNNSNLWMVYIDTTNTNNYKVYLSSVKSSLDCYSDVDTSFLVRFVQYLSKSYFFYTTSKKSQ